MPENKLRQRLLWRELTIISNQSRKNCPIGFFDSGVGGLTVLSECRKLMPSEDFIFFGDTAHMPYGEKTKEQLMYLSTCAFDFFEKLDVKAVVMACNTTSAVVYEELKDKYNFKLYPLIQSVAKTFSELDVNTIGVFATQATINSHAYSRCINNLNPKIKVIEIACPEWVKIVENNDLTERSKENIKANMLEMSGYKPDKVILGCTHYPYLLSELTKYAQPELFINPANLYAKIIKNDLSEKGLLNDYVTNGKDMFFVSGNPENFRTAGKLFYNLEDKGILRTDDMFM